MWTSPPPPSAKPELGTSGYGYCRPESTVGNWVSWVFEVDGHEINVVRNDVVQTTELRRWVGEMLIGLWSWDCWGNPLTDHDNSIFEWWDSLSTATPKVGSEHRLKDRSNKSTTLGKLSCYHFYKYYSQLLWSFEFTNPPQEEALVCQVPYHGIRSRGTCSWCSTDVWIRWRKCVQ